MKLSFPHLLLTGAVLGVLVWMSPADAQETAPTDDLAPLVKTIIAQQQTINANQANIDKSLAAIQENMRQAKIYIGRSGSAKAAK
jgi:hypothetical protein